MKRTRTIEIIALLVAIVTVLVTIANPEVRSYLGLEDESERAVESREDGQNLQQIGNWFHKDILYHFNEKGGECTMVTECDCCGGDLVFRKDGKVIYVFSCAGSPVSYHIGNYEMVGDSIHCQMKAQYMEMADDPLTGEYVVATVRSEPFELWVHRSSCMDYPYEVNLGEDFDAYLHRLPGWDYQTFIKGLKEYNVYEGLMKL